MTHNEYWANVKREAEERICALFDNCKTSIADIVGDENGIDSFRDAHKVLVYVLRHGNYSDHACAILSFSAWCHADHELKEHGTAGAVPIN